MHKDLSRTHWLVLIKPDEGLVLGLAVVLGVELVDFVEGLLGRSKDGLEPVGPCYSDLVDVSTLANLLKPFVVLPLARYFYLLHFLPLLVLSLLFVLVLLLLALLLPLAPLPVIDDLNRLLLVRWRNQLAPSVSELAHAVEGSHLRLHHHYLVLCSLVPMLLLFLLPRLLCSAHPISWVCIVHVEEFVGILILEREVLEVTEGL
jgi:hypothetical protein